MEAEYRSKPAFDSDYVSLMVTGCAHCVNVPMAARLGDFSKPTKILVYTAHTEGYKGEPVEGVGRIKIRYRSYFCSDPGNL